MEVNLQTIGLVLQVSKSIVVPLFPVPLDMLTKACVNPIAIPATLLVNLLETAIEIIENKTVVKAKQSPLSTFKT